MASKISGIFPITLATDPKKYETSSNGKTYSGFSAVGVDMMGNVLSIGFPNFRESELPSKGELFHAKGELETTVWKRTAFGQTHERNDSKIRVIEIVQG